MKLFSIAASVLLLSSAAFAADQSRTIEVRPPNGQAITIVVAPQTEGPYALTGNHDRPSVTDNHYDTRTNDALQSNNASAWGNQGHN